MFKNLHLIDKANSSSAMPCRSLGLCEFTTFSISESLRTSNRPSDDSTIMSPFFTRNSRTSESRVISLEFYKNES